MKLGYASPARMLGELKPSELGTWAALYEMEPWGEKRADMRAGIIASTLANVNRGKSSEPFSPSDFMPRFDRSDEKPKAGIAARLKNFLLGRPNKD